MGLICQCDECGKLRAIEARVESVPRPDLGRSDFAVDFEIIPEGWPTTVDKMRWYVACSPACSEKLSKRLGCSAEIKYVEGHKVGPVPEKDEGELN